MEEDYRILENELHSYKEELVHKTHFLVLNKIDKVSVKKLKKLEKHFALSSCKTVRISALNGDGIEELKVLLGETLEKYHSLSPQASPGGKDRFDSEDAGHGITGEIDSI